ncbi:MAG: SLOG family protein, partial [Eubacteriales bacterium]|nr:SLOG family protein [Eubacteriales bacterium]
GGWMQDLFNRISGCCFTGHRPDALPAFGNEQAEEMISLVYLLNRAVESAIEDGVTEFYVGGAQGFDTLAAECVLRQRETHPALSLHLALPGKNQTSGWNARDKARYASILSEATDVWYAHDLCSPESMKRRNRYLVDHTGRCVAYLRRMRGGTLYTVNYALDSAIPVDNLAERMMML